MPKKLKHHAAPWSDLERASLKKYAREGLSAREAAKKLGRTLGGTKFKAMTEGVRFHAIRQPVGVQKKLAVKRRKHGMAATLRRAA